MPAAYVAHPALLLLQLYALLQACQSAQMPMLPEPPQACPATLAWWQQHETLRLSALLRLLQWHHALQLPELHVFLHPSLQALALPLRLPSPRWPHARFLTSFLCLQTGPIMHCHGFSNAPYSMLTM
jgi:hypothetical protein